MTNETDRLHLAGEAILFGFPTTPAHLTVRQRPASWRMTGAALRMAVGLLIAAVVVVVPPHAPWLIGALAGGAIMARRRWIERYTLEAAEATCPKCGEPLKVSSGRLRTPHPVTCERCHHESALRIEAGALPA